MNTLAQQQQALLEALFASPAQAAVQHLGSYAVGVGASPQRGLKTYQANGHMLAERALRAAFPVMEQMLGKESFADLARAFWHAHPPLSGDIAQWGQALADFVCSGAQLQDVPYLPDVARAEWALHRAASLPDQEADLATLALLTSEDPQTLALQLAPGLCTLSSAWPLASLVLAHREGEPALAEVAALLRKQVVQDVVIWRAGWQPRLRLALPGELVLLGALQSGAGLGPALDAAPTLDFAQWLPLAVQTGLVLGATRLFTNPQEPPT